VSGARYYFEQTTQGGVQNSHARIDRYALVLIWCTIAGA
jgi:hypothetical protein